MTAELAPIDPPDDSRYDEPDYYDEESPVESDYLPCTLCGCLIGDEVGYGDNYGECPICDNCVKPWDSNEECNDGLSRE
jgi:hypothetical protein